MLVGAEGALLESRSDPTSMIESVAFTPQMPTRDAFQSLPLAEQFRLVRQQTEHLAGPLQTEDYVVQSMTDVSPTKWHLAHTTWFWETFVLQPYLPGYKLFDASYPFLFNSYYVQAGERHCRAQRGYLSRPTVREVYEYRAYVDERMSDLLAGLSHDDRPRLTEVVLIGLHHEQQHQELILTDIKHVFSVNPLRPAYTKSDPVPTVAPDPLRWIEFEDGLHEIGYHQDLDGPFSFDNESPRHRAYVQPYALADRLVTCGEYLEFINSGGYDDAAHWLSEGFAHVQQESWKEPFYWERRDNEWWHYTLHGMRRVDPNEPVTHLSYYEADAFARWAGHRLPTEFEWEIAARSLDQGIDSPGAFVESARLHPAAAATPAGGDGAPQPERFQQLFGVAWQWTQSHYSPYPGYRAAPGTLGEYNGKWMCNQFVLRGGSCATSRTHIRTSYRNFFHSSATWQFTGIRLARLSD